MAQWRNLAGPAANIGALVVAVAAVTIWSARLEHRVSSLEAKVETLASGSAARGVPGDSARAGMSLEQACANLAIRAGDAARSPEKTAAGQSAAARELMAQLGCTQK
jgi:hypothetical protein